MRKSVTISSPNSASKQVIYRRWRERREDGAEVVRDCFFSIFPQPAQTLPPSLHCAATRVHRYLVRTGRNSGNLSASDPISIQTHQSPITLSDRIGLHVSKRMTKIPRTLLLPRFPERPPIPSTGRGELKCSLRTTRSRELKCSTIVY